MPISLRLPTDLETRIAGFGSRTGLSKSAVIVRSIQEFLARNAAPSSLQIYESAIRDAKHQLGDVIVGRTNATRSNEELEQRPTKLALRQTLRDKHTERSQRATKALAAKRATKAKSP
jgi:predicted transcriptional regulator